MIREQLASVRAIKDAARSLSTACIDHLTPLSGAAPLVGYYNRSVLDQPVSVEITWLLGKLK